MPQDTAKKLVKTRGVLKGSITRIEGFIDKANQQTEPSEIRLRKDRLLTLFKEYTEIQIQLEIEDETQSDDFEKEEERYYKILGKIDQLLSSRSNSAFQSGSGYNASAANIKLPTITLPLFNGDYKEWPSFKDLFLNLVHDNNDIADVEKLYHLKLSLKGEAGRLIQNIDSSGDNYLSAWNQLLDRYDNKLLTLNKHLKAIVDFPKVTKGSGSSLRKLLTDFQQHLSSLEGLKVPNLADCLLVFILSQKLDPDTLCSFQMQQAKNTIPTLKDFTKYLDEKASAMEMSTSRVDDTRPQKFERHSAHNHLVKKGTQCRFCGKGNHPLFRCFKFIGSSVDKKHDFVKQNHLCFNCLQSHKGPCPSNSSCCVCAKRHHSLLHNSSNTSPGELPMQSQRSSSAAGLAPLSASVQSPRSEHSREHPVPSQALFTSDLSSSLALMATAIVDVSANGKSIPCRLILDNASERNFVSHRIISSLGIQGTPCHWQVGGVGGITASVNQTVKLCLESRYRDFQAVCEFGVLSYISDPCPRTSFSKKALRWPRFIKLADPNFNITDQIDMLIGIEFFYQLLLKGKIELGNGQPVLQETLFGWVIAGPLKIPHVPSSERYRCHLTSNISADFPDLQETVSKFWSLEELPKQRILSISERQCEKYYVDSLTRSIDGRYEVDLPVIPEKLQYLGNSYGYALQCLLSLEKRFQRNPELQRQYKDFIQEYVDLGHARFVNVPCESSDHSFYMPHHAIIKLSSSTTKLRVVFNASAPSSSGLSLNDALMAGPVVQPDLFDIILKFRTYKFVITADIKKMYRQINIKQHQTLQRILWRDSSSESVKCLQLTTVTYGTRPASFLATRTLVQLAQDEGAPYPLAAEALLQNSYVDDIITGANDFSTAVKLREELDALLKRGCFELHKWCSNYSSILENVPAEKRETPNFVFSDNKNAVKTLGLLWCPIVDKFQLNVSPELMTQRATKRSILAITASIFDPLGLIAPITTTAKIFMQDLWKENCAWDDPIPSHLKPKWIKFSENISKVKNISVPRHLLPLDTIHKIEIHGFSDASTKAYGAACYLLIIDPNGTAASNLICAKSRVAPIKTVSLPRLELCAAVLLSKMVDKLKSIFSFKINRVVYWTDSTIVLSWIASEPARWSTFVANRTAAIQRLTSQTDWRHVPSHLNPADVVSRGMSPQDLESCSLWWNGPKHIKLNDLFWPSLPSVNSPIELTIEESRKRVTAHFQVSSCSPQVAFWNNIFMRFSSFIKLKRAVAYVLRFVHNSRNPTKRVGCLSVNELSEAVRIIIKTIQFDAFKKEILHLQDSDKLANTDCSIKNTNLRLLHPFLDGDGLMRVGGRLSNAAISFNQKHPLILPYGNHVTNLILTQEHEKLLHAGPQATLANLRLRFWPINGRRAINSIIHKCIRCHKFRATLSSQLMSDLPSIRVNRARPFENVGLDYAGPVNIKQSRIRRTLITKGYICVFVCMATKALHLELVSNMTTKTFLSAFHRFTARRGKPSQVYSDNGKNFVGARNELHKLYRLFNNRDIADEINNHLANDNIRWHFIPPAAPHWGGIWESGVKSVKHHLKRTMGNTTLTYEELNTLLVQIEGILNSRPLCPLSDGADEVDYLTPAHFLIGDVLTALPEETIPTLNVQHLSAFKQIQHLKNCFWRKWSKEYLSFLQQRRKWTSQAPSVQPNSVVLVKEDNLPPLQWRVARVVETIAGKDGLVRAVKLKTPNGVFVRPITKICVLPLESAKTD